MRIKFYLLLIMCVPFVMSSCTEKEIEPYVTESKVLDSGIENVGVETSATFSYNSWIDVDRKMFTKSATRVTQKLTNSFNAVIDTIEVQSFTLGNDMPEVELSYKNSDITPGNNNFVYVKDSIIICTMKHKNFTYSYDIKVQKAMYDDLISNFTILQI